MIQTIQSTEAKSGLKLYGRLRRQLGNQVQRNWDNNYPTICSELDDKEYMLDQNKIAILFYDSIPSW